jgi:Type III restriction enzyme, res subunit
MSRIPPLPFQERHIDGLIERFLELKRAYDALGVSPPPAELNRLRQTGACVLLQAPTGIGKTLMACELISRFSPEDKVVWLWFAPFTGVLEQARATLKRQAPSLTQLGVDSDRQAEKLVPGAIFVLSWQTVAARSKDSKLARQSGDAGVALDDLLKQARHEGFRIGVVVDEAHHGFVGAPEASRFFANVLTPEYVLLMTATPRDADAARFATITGYQIGGQAQWASVPRSEGVEAQLLKVSVKAARFIAQNADDAQLLAYEEVAMSECAIMHRRIKQVLGEQKVGLTPLMLVQVPNGGEMVAKAKKYLVEKLRFAEDTVRVHTADEPDPNLAALADDPAVEVIVFKMAIATGFDAPRAFTLAALRGTRDADFGVQVVGRIMRVHRLLQGRLDELPKLLRYGYVFLANSAAQEGLVAAAAQINQMPSQLAGAVPSTVVTIVQGEPTVQVTKPGQTFSLLPREAATPSTPAPAGSEPATVALAQQASLFQVLATPEGTARPFAHDEAASSPLSLALELDSQSQGIVYELKEGMPRSFTTERMPTLPDDFELRLVAHIDFSRVLGDRLKIRSRVVERTTDVFTAEAPEDKDVWASVSAAAIAERARQVALHFDDVDQRELLRALKDRFRAALQNEGHEAPESDEELTRQLELVLVRNDRLVREAHKRLRAEQVAGALTHLPPAMESEVALAPALRNVYGVFPDGLGIDEREFAELLDTSAEVLWWHRNPSRKPESVALYRWSDGTAGFFPDFVVGVRERIEGDGAALAEVKGPHLQQFDKAKAGARHIHYGRVFMVGKTGASGGFRLWRLTTDQQLVDDGPFEAQRMRHS